MGIIHVVLMGFDGCLMDRLMNLTTVEPLAPVPPPVLYRPAVLGVETLADYHYRPMLHVARRNV